MKMRRNKKTSAPATFDRMVLAKQIQQEAKAVGLSSQTAEMVVKKIAWKVEEWVEDKTVITENDLNQRIAREAEQYSADLAYVYENRGKII